VGTDQDAGPYGLEPDGDESVDIETFVIGSIMVGSSQGWGVHNSSAAVDPERALPHPVRKSSRIGNTVADPRAGLGLIKSLQVPRHTGGADSSRSAAGIPIKVSSATAHVMACGQKLMNDQGRWEEEPEYNDGEAHRAIGDPAGEQRVEQQRRGEERQQRGLTVRTGAWRRYIRAPLPTRSGAGHAPARSVGGAFRRCQRPGASASRCAG
jgi:hypothetical protein